MPVNAVKAGTTATDGDTYVGRAVQDGEPGKINLDAGKMYNFWCQSRWSGQQEAEVLVVEARPVVVATATPITVSAQAAPAATVPEPPPQSRRPPIPEEHVPSAPSSFPKLERMSMPQLGYYQDNSVALDDLLVDLPQVSEFSERARKLREENRGTAAELLAREAVLGDSVRGYEGAADALRQRRESVQGLIRQRDGVLQQQSPQQLASALQSRAQRSDAGAEDCLQQALTSHCALDGAAFAEFRQQYLLQKTDKHARLALLERLAKT